MTMTHPRTLALIALTAALSAGCSTTSTIPQWQKEVEDFVNIEGNGDLNALRDAHNASGRRIMAVHGGEDPAKSTDVVGIVLGPRTFDNRPAYVFLVGIIERGTPQDIRIATLSRKGKDLMWRIDTPDPKTLATYRRGRQSKPTRYAPSLLWPPKEDIYEVTSTSHNVTVTELRSGAKWEMETGSGKKD